MELDNVVIHSISRNPHKANSKTWNSAPIVPRSYQTRSLLLQARYHPCKSGAGSSCSARPWAEEVTWIQSCRPETLPRSLEQWRHKYQAARASRRMLHYEGGELGFSCRRLLSTATLRKPGTLVNVMRQNLCHWGNSDVFFWKQHTYDSET